MIRTWLVGGVLLAISVPAAATAQDSDVDARARQLFEEGRDLYARSRYEEALDRFQRSYELSHRAMLLYNIGLAADRARRDQQALDAYEAYLRQVLDAPNREEVTERVRVLRAALARVAARSGGGGDRGGTPADEGDGSGGGVLSQWWFWGIVIAVAAGVTAGVLLATATEEREEPIPGNLGGVITVLRAP